MKFLDLSISDFFRYAITGCQLYMLVIVSDIRVVRENIKEFSEKALFYLSLGIICFYIYRTFVYPFILKVMDKTINRTENVRAVIIKKYGDPKTTTWDEINDLWQHILHKFNEDLDIDKGRVWAHSIHVLYITCIISLAGSFAVYFRSTNVNYYAFYIASTFACGFAAITSDLKYQKRLFRNLLLNSDNNIDCVIETYKTGKRSYTEQTIKN